MASYLGKTISTLCAALVMGFTANAQTALVPTKLNTKGERNNFEKELKKHPEKYCRVDSSMIKSLGAKARIYPEYNDSFQVVGLKQVTSFQRALSEHHTLLLSETRQMTPDAKGYYSDSAHLKDAAIEANIRYAAVENPGTIMQKDVDETIASVAAHYMHENSGEKAVVVGGTNASDLSFKLGGGNPLSQYKEASSLIVSDFVKRMIADESFTEQRRRESNYQHNITRFIKEAHRGW